MNSISISEAKDRLNEFIHAAAHEKQQFRIASEEGNVVLLSEETYQNILVTLELLSTPGLWDNFESNSCCDSSLNQ